MTTVIFVLSCSRSGTQSVAESHGLLHEPDSYWPSVAKAMERARGRIVYGETSNFWKGKLYDLVKAFPDAHYYHLVRNGRDVVCSILNRGAYMYEPGEQPYRSQRLPVSGFDGMTRFEKVCWYWRYFNNKIERVTQNRVRLEDLNLPVRLNAGPPHPQLTTTEEEAFQRICGEMMTRYGYSLVESR